MKIKWLTRIGEGLLIGLGASIAFAVFTGMSDATKALTAAKGRLLSQDKINIEYRELIEQSSKENQAIKKYIEEELSRLNENVDKIATKLEVLGNIKEGTKERPPEWDSSIWEELKSNRNLQKPLPVINPESPWLQPDENSAVKLRNLNESINVQQEIQFR